MMRQNALRDVCVVTRTLTVIYRIATALPCESRVYLFHLNTLLLIQWCIGTTLDRFIASFRGHGQCIPQRKLGTTLSVVQSHLSGLGLGC